MKTKNIFRTLLMAAFLLAGANIAKADIIYNNAGGTSQYEFSYTDFAKAAGGDKLRITYTIQPQDNWTPTYKVILKDRWWSNNLAEAAVTANGTVELTLTDEMFSGGSINTTDQYNRGAVLIGEWVTITKIELVAGAASGSHAITIADGITNGTLSSDKATAEKDETVTLTAVSAAGYKLKNFVVNGSTSKVTITSVQANADGTTTTVGSFTMANSDVTVSAEFVDKNILYEGDPSQSVSILATEFSGATTNMALRIYTTGQGNMNLGGAYHSEYQAEWIWSNDAAQYYNLDGGFYEFAIFSDWLTELQSNGINIQTEYNSRVTKVMLVEQNVPSKTNVTLTYSSATAETTTASIGETLANAPTLTVSPEGLEGILYSSSNTGVATVAADGTVTIVGAGITVITATFEETDTYNGASASYTLTVSKLNVTMSFSEEAASAKMEQPFTPPTLTVSPEGLEGITYSSSNSDVATVDNDGNVTLVAPGVTVITASFAETAVYNSASTSYTLTVAEADVPTFTVAVSEPANGQISVSPTTDVIAGTTVTITATPDDGYKLSGITVTGDDGTSVDVYGSGNTRTFTMPSQNVTVSATFAEIEKVTATISSSTGLATFCSDKALDFTGITTIEAYYATTVEIGNVYLLRVYGTVAAGTGLIIKGSTTSIPVADSGEYLSGNLLIGVTSDTEVNAATDYVLTEKNGAAVFAQTGVKAATVAAGHAYLRVSTAQARAFSIIGLGGEGTTGIENTFVDDNEAGEKVIYNLNGQRVKNPTKGLYIINGKKVLVK